MKSCQLPIDVIDLVEYRMTDGVVDSSDQVVDLEQELTRLPLTVTRLAQGLHCNIMSTGSMH